MNLRSYQIIDYAAINEAFESVDRVLYQLSTGGGKTVVISQFVNDVMEQEKKFLILVHKEKLLRQMVKTLKSMGLWIGHIIRNEHVNLDARCIVASVSTVMRDNRIDLIKDREFDYIVIDEAHHAVANSFNKVIDAANHGKPCKILGVTATPHRADKKNLKDIFDHLVVSSASMRELINQKYLSPYKVYATPVKDLQAKVGKAGSDYKMSDLSKYMREPEMIDYLIESYEKFALGRKMICFCVDTKHASDVMEAYIQKGYEKVAYIDAGTKPNDREQIFDDFQNGDLEIIFCIETLTEGIDLPECTAVQLARPTLSLILYLQMVGRGLRPKKDGGDCVIIDNSGITYEFGVPDAKRNWQLDSDLNPVIKSDKILVAKTKDGKLTDDIENEEYSELLEMDWEEFMSQSMMTEEEVKEHNEKIKIKKLQTLEEIGNFIIKESKLPNLEFRKNWDAESFEIRVKGDYYQEISFELNKYSDEKSVFGLSFRSNGSKSPNNVFEHANFNFVILKIVQNNFSRIEKVFSFISDQKKKEINLNELRKVIGEKKKVLVRNLLETELQKGITEFKFEGDIWASHLKPSFDGKIRMIQFINPKLNKSCKVDVTYETWNQLRSTGEKFVDTENILSVFEKYFENNL